jgi:hypothetical protein
MTRQHFQVIAEALASLKPDRGNRYASRTVQTKGAAAFAQWEATVRGLAFKLASYNPRFNFSRFYKACGLEE